MPTSLAAQILVTQDLAFEDVVVPEWDNIKLRICAMSGADRDAWERTITRIVDGKAVPDTANFRGRLLVRCIVDPDTGAGRATVLLVEDDEDNIVTVADYLTFKHFRVLVARNGREALELAPVQQPDVIVMDIQMPEMDGLEAIQKLRRTPGLTTTPIVALTALAMAGDRERCLQAGANEYLSKPVSLRQLATLIDELLGTP